MDWSTIARWWRRSGPAGASGVPSYSDLRATPTRTLPADLTASEADPAFTMRRDALQRRLLADARPADNAPLFTELVSARPKGVVTFALPDGERCMPVFTSMLRAADYRSVLVSPGIDASFLVSSPARFLRMLRDIEAGGITMLSLDRCPRCATFTVVRTQSLTTVDDVVGLWAITKATECARLELRVAYALESARAGRFAVARDVALDTVGHVCTDDPRLHLLLGQLGVALREPSLTGEALLWLRTMGAQASVRMLEAAAASGVATFAEGAPPP